MNFERNQVLLNNQEQRILELPSPSAVESVRSALYRRYGEISRAQKTIRFLDESDPDVFSVHVQATAIADNEVIATDEPVVNRMMEELHEYDLRHL